MTPSLKKLADTIGILTSYSDGSTPPIEHKIDENTIRLLAEKYGYEFVDLYSPLFNLETGEIYAEYTTDGGHLTPMGYEVVTNAVAPTLKRLLGR